MRCFPERQRHPKARPRNLGRCGELCKGIQRGTPTVYGVLEVNQITTNAESPDRTTFDDNPWTRLVLGSLLASKIYPRCPAAALKHDELDARRD